MGPLPALRFLSPVRRASGRRIVARLFLPVFALALLSGCHRVEPVDTKPLDSAGMGYDSIHELQEMQISTAEVASAATARQSGFSDAHCVEVFKIYRGRHQPFSAGEAIAGLISVGVREDTVQGLAELNQLGLGAGELQAIKLAGLSDGVILEVARHRAAAKPVLAGASLAALRNAGVRESTILELARRGIPDSQADEIVALRKHGASDVQILARFIGSP
jgi:hypothetical protein